MQEALDWCLGTQQGRPVPGGVDAQHPRTCALAITGQHGFSTASNTERHSQLSSTSTTTLPGTRTQQPQQGGAAALRQLATFR